MTEAEYKRAGLIADAHAVAGGKNLGKHRAPFSIHEHPITITFPWTIHGGGIFGGATLTEALDKAEADVMHYLNESIKRYRVRVDEMMQLKQQVETILSKGA